ncbi:Na+/H+ antiporter subunit A [Alkalicoccobacillus murimartini]|uniref:Multicomponent Na+:H+ antiporter subunit A n=1 Tax=Alkalicoccobacillus murimartini TaxID=171685 RepID=A0ABT9YDE1_9BACI|nr:Na+/H+ antiporter subunit A [Alkalicoccobacillus murimartini]MDQ0205500.1 multicomponent Na+:H+ antiporter subunit A [Alkalicoccobacillus murimartini]
MSTLHLAILAPFIGALIIPFWALHIKRVHSGWIVFAIPLALFIYFLGFLSTTSSGQTVQETINWVPSLGINFTAYIDGLSLLFALLISGVGALVVLYSIFYLDKKKESLHQFYVYLLMFMGAMVGVVLSDNLIVLYIFWELTSLASALLISYWYGRKKSIYGAQKSMLITVFGGFSMLAGFCLLYGVSGTFSIRELIAQADIIAASSVFIPAMILVLLGAFTKSAQFPFHIWLPDAMEAPTPVSAYLHSATMVKAGIYLVARLTPLFAGGAQWFWIITIVGLVTLLWGSLSAVRQKDLKGILAYSTISQLGMIMLLLGLGSAAYYVDSDQAAAYYSVATVAAVLHLINHATFKGSLFMAVGIIDHETGTRDIRKLGGLMAIMPVTFTVSLIGLAAMAGLPPFNGFISKEMFFTGMLHAITLEGFNMGTWAVLIPIIAWIASIFTFLYCGILFIKTFLGTYTPEKHEKKAHEAPIGMLISPILLASLVVVFGFFPNLLSDSIIKPAVTSIMPALSTNASFDISLSMFHGFNLELFMTIGVVVGAISLLLLMKKWQSLQLYQRERDPLNVVYDRGLDGLISGSQFVTRLQMTGLLRDYFSYMITFIVFILTYTAIKYGAFIFGVSHTAPIPIYVWVLTVIFITATISILFIRKRMTLIIMVGILGFLMALFFVIFRAPDLALTQLLVETVSILLFMLAFYHLPELPKETAKQSLVTRNVVISVAVGSLVTLMGISSFIMGSDLNLASVSEYFIQNSKELGGGYNMVNVILVDFRGLDTILEGLVLAIAALSVVAMIKLRFKGGEDT